MRCDVSEFQARLFRRGFVASDFKEQRLLPNLLVLAPIKRPSVVAGLVLGDDPRFEALSFRVLAKGETRPIIVSGFEVDTLDPQVGDTICIRNALSEPVQPDRAVVIVDRKYCWAILSTALEEATRISDDAEREAQAKAEIEAARAALVKF